MNARSHPGSFRNASVALVLWLGWTAHGVAAQGAGPLPPAVVTNPVVILQQVAPSNAVPLPAGEGSRRRGTALPDLSWVPPADAYDWIQLKSGEWLKGRIKAMQDRELEFRSEELDLQTFNWKDIRQLRSPRLLDVLFVDGEELSGPVTISPAQVTVGSVEPQTRPRDQLQSLTPGGSKERNLWSGKASLGLSLRSGNTRSFDYNAQAHLQRRTPATRLSLDYIGNVSSMDKVETANNHRVNSEFDLWLSRRFYLLLPFVQYYRDPFKNLAHQTTVGLGAGYDLIDRPGLEWNITTGPAYQYSWFESSQTGESSEKGAAALALNSRFDWDITSRIELILEYRGIYTSRETGETTHHGVSTLSLELTKRLDLDVSFIWDRISNPKPGADGVEPEPDDFRLVVSFGVDF